MICVYQARNFMVLLALKSPFNFYYIFCKFIVFINYNKTSRAEDEKEDLSDLRQGPAGRDQAPALRALS